MHASACTRSSTLSDFTLIRFAPSLSRPLAPPHLYYFHIQTLSHTEYEEAKEAKEIASITSLIHRHIHTLNRHLHTINRHIHTLNYISLSHIHTPCAHRISRGAGTGSPKGLGSTSRGWATGGQVTTISYVNNKNDLKKNQLGSTSRGWATGGQVRTISYVNNKKDLKTKFKRKCWFPMWVIVSYLMNDLAEIKGPKSRGSVAGGQVYAWYMPPVLIVKIVISSRLDCREHILLQRIYFINSYILLSWLFHLSSLYIQPYHD